NDVSDDYVAFIVGSDQVWRPKMYVNSEDSYAYFLEFVPDYVPRISYAASFGVDKWERKANDKLTERVKESLKRFSSISVREESGVSICRDYFGVASTHVLDPTLLVGRNYFEDIIKDENFGAVKAGIAYYKLDTDESFLREIDSLADSIGQEVENIYYKEVAG